MAYDAAVRDLPEATLVDALGEEEPWAAARRGGLLPIRRGEAPSALHNARPAPAGRGVAALAVERERIRAVTLVRLEAVRQRIADAFARDAAARGHHVTVTIEHDLVTLRGQVASWAERQAVQCAAAATPGVADVRNELLVEPWPFAPVLMA